MDRRRFLKLSGAGVAGAILLTTVGAGNVLARPASDLEREFEDAAKEYKVPVEILLAMGYVNTRWEMPPPEASAYEKSKPGLGNPDAQGVYGIMALSENPQSDSLGEASRLTRTPRKALKQDRAANIRGAAAVLGSTAGAKKPHDLAGWYNAVAQYGGTAYADRVFETLREGASARTSTGETVALGAHPDVRLPRRQAAATTGEYPGSEFRPANPDNYGVSNREATYDINKVVIHVAQGTYEGTLTRFQSPGIYASAHYTVGTDGKVGQSVREKDVAWHAGNLAYNQTSIGIEHAGFVDKPSTYFTPAMYAASARLTAYLCRKYNIPIDRNHIIGHNEVPDPYNPGQYGGAYHHTDPGSGWDWTKYMSLVRKYAGYSQVVDNATTDRFSAGSNWGTSTYAGTDHYGSTHRYLSPGSTFSPAKFKINVPARDTYDVYGWWPAASGYNDRTRFRIYTASGWVSKIVSQRTNGGKWVLLGRYTLNAGDAYWVQVSNLSAGSGLIVADAVRIVRR